MNDSHDHLYNLLPAIYRQRDAERGYPLQALLRVIAEQVEVVEADIAQLYENWFIETCQDWVVPYLGDLVGYRPVYEAGEQAPARDKILIPRQEVANTIRHRRRKGTLALLEELALAVSGWPARAVEFYKLLAQTQSVKHPRPAWGQSVDMRRGQALRLLNSPFDELAHRVDVRRLNSQYAPGRYNLPNVALFVWRSRVYSLTQTPAYCLEDLAPHYYTFSLLGNDAPLYRRPETADRPTDIAGPANLPGPISRTAFEADKNAFYGPGRSIQLWVGPTRQPIPVEAIVIADLSHWTRYQARRGQVAVDPYLGRILFHPREAPQKGLWVSFYYGFAADIGGGEYERPLSQPAGATFYRVGPSQAYRTLEAAINAWKSKPTPNHAVIEISQSIECSEILTITLEQNQTLQIRAANRTRPVIRQINKTGNIPDLLNVTLAAGSRFTLDGLLIAGQGVRFAGPVINEKNRPAWEQEVEEASSSPPPSWNQPAEVIIRHTTLVPGWSLLDNCDPLFPTDYSLTLDHIPVIQVKIERSILGSIKVLQDEVQTDPISIQINDSILDATATTIDALSSGDRIDEADADRYHLAHAVLTIARSTVFGGIFTHAIDLAENSIFDGLVEVGRRQRGCMRFCYVDPEKPARPPLHRYNCQPDLIRKVTAEKLRQAAEEADPPKAPPTRDQIKTAQGEAARTVYPRFKSKRYGGPTYAQLAEECADEIKQGADDGSEMGVFHHLYNPQREANLRARLAEYTPADMEVRLIFAEEYEMKNVHQPVVRHQE